MLLAYRAASFAPRFLVLTSNRAEYATIFWKRQGDAVLSPMREGSRRSPHLRGLLGGHLPPLWNATRICRRIRDRLTASPLCTGAILIYTP